MAQVKEQWLAREDAIHQRHIALHLCGYGEPWHCCPCEYCKNRRKENAT